MNYPLFLMKEILWNFNQAPYETQDLFYEALKNYNEEITGQKFDLKIPIAIYSNELTVQYRYWDEREEDDVEEEIELKANNIFFNKIELLYKVHNAVCDKLKGQDYHFLKVFYCGMEKIQIIQIFLITR